MRCFVLTSVFRGAYFGGVKNSVTEMHRLFTFKLRQLSHFHKASSLVGVGSLRGESSLNNVSAKTRHQSRGKMSRSGESGKANRFA
jgi:hypothetical protein